MHYEKELFFYNIYTQKDDSFVLTWDFEDGFQDIEQARIAILAAGQNPEQFLYIKHHGFLYPVATNLMEQAIVISQDYIWYRESSTERIHKVERDSYTKLPYILNRVNNYEYYKITMCKDLDSFDKNMRIIPGLGVKTVSNSYKDFCVATLGASMVSSMIPSYQLCCMDAYFRDINPFIELWQFGIKSYNPFNGYREIAPYTMEAYLKDNNKQHADDLHEFTYIRNALLDMGVMKDVSLGETIKLPFHFGRKIVFALNALLSEITETTIIGADNTDINQMSSFLQKDIPKTANAELAEKSLHFCRMCHVSLPSYIIDNICPVCKEQELFIAVKDYIREKDVTEREVADHFNISLHKVRTWIKEGRITYKEVPGIKTERPGSLKLCRECGIMLPSNSKDNLCQACLELGAISKAHSSTYHPSMLPKYSEKSSPESYQAEHFMGAQNTPQKR